MDGISGLRSWQWMFLTEGLPMIPLGVITYLFLNSLPSAVQCKVKRIMRTIFHRSTVNIKGWITVKNNF